MSLNQTGKDDVMTVEEAIAFIDSFDGLWDEDSDSGNAASPHTSSASSDSGIVFPAVTSKPKTKTNPKRKRKGNPPDYTTRIQQHNKAELLDLREEVRGLERVLDLAKRPKPMLNSGDDSEARSKWEQLAAAEYDERRRSKETNRRLRAILAHQVEVDKNLRRILRKRALLQGVDFVFGNEPTSRYSFAAFENSKSIMDHLEQKVLQLYLDSGSVFPQGGDPPSSISCKMQMKHHSVFGMTAEALSTTSMPCPMEMSADMCWRDLSIHRPCPEKWARCMKGNAPDSQEKNWTLTIRSPSYVKQVKGVQLLRKFSEPNRVVIVKADLMTLNNEELQFRNQTWTIISRSDTNPNASLVRVCEQMYLDRQVGVTTAGPEDVEYAQSVVLRNLNWKLREHTQHLQDVLVEEIQRYGVVSAVAGY